MRLIQNADPPRMELRLAFYQPMDIWAAYALSRDDSDRMGGIGKLIRPTTFVTILLPFGVIEWGGGVAEGRLRSIPCKSCKSRQTPIEPMGFYVASGPIGGNKPVAPAGSYGDEYAPISEVCDKEQDHLTGPLEKGPVILDVYLEEVAPNPRLNLMGRSTRVGRLYITSGLEASNQAKLLTDIAKLVLGCFPRHL